MDEIHFEPAYPPRALIAPLVAALPGLGALAASASLGLGIRIAMVSLVATVALPAFAMRRRVRRIVFGEKLIVIRMTMSDRYLNYRQVVRVDRGMLTTERGAFRTDEWRNQEELLSILRRLREAGRLPSEVFGNDTGAE